MYVKCSSIKRGQKILENSINKINNNLQKLGLDLSSKTIDNNKVKSSKSVRFLGLFFDYNMSFSTHKNIIQQRCSKALNIIKYLRGTWWGFHPNTLLTLYKSFVWSIVDYCSFVYFPTSKCSKEKIEKIQYAAIRLALGFRRSTPTNILIAESKLPFLEDRASYLGKYYISKNLSNTNSSILKTIKSFFNISKKHPTKHTKILYKYLSSFLTDNNLPQIDHKENFNIYSYDFSTITTMIPIHTSLGKNILRDALSGKNFNSSSRIDDLLDHDALDIYTDGSKIAGSNAVGAAYFCPKLN